MPPIDAPGKQAGTRLPPPLPRPSGAGERRGTKESLRDQFVLPGRPAPAPVAPSLFALRSPTHLPQPEIQTAPKGLTQNRRGEFHLNCEPRHCPSRFHSVRCATVSDGSFLAHISWKTYHA